MVLVQRESPAQPGGTQQALRLAPRRRGAKKGKCTQRPSGRNPSAFSCARQGMLQLQRPHFGSCSAREHTCSALPVLCTIVCLSVCVVVSWSPDSCAAAIFFIFNITLPPS